ncbi:uncharacterized protein PFL1_00661 [Pseudozyma flocculosa PF-1]|uniref:RING-type domain-containing protein n=1 Tax=Pseudozyma flocculosa TaxID=84751 RepID=A0A5C3EQ99_9BASI|nr:uncharacterized protein PFL1_00661 [Pseudozyma flocculosa PF-1]EPQ32466.1 hypothetical protein PFL1_00661 [Pseudozyma flocculosa PF-1]SPO34544.1 uncharacterized protein PSFLO_00015 [Pseudozyma flocculosa]
MGQQVTKEQGSPSSHGRSSSGQLHGHSHGHGAPPSSSVSGLAAASSSTSAAPASPPPLPPHLSDSVQVDKGGLVPQGVYTGPQDYDQHVVRQAVVDRRLAPFCKGSDDEDTYESEPFNSECPICFLYYPSPLNFSRCCHQPICTECFVQMKRADPNATNPPSSEARSCPFCVEPDFGVTYTSPSALEAQKVGPSSAAATAAAGSPGSGSSSGSDSPNDASDAANFAERAIGTGGAAGSKGSGKKKVLPVDDPAVITVDQVRPDWHVKLAQAQATIARRANRRVIMRQVGDRLIPIGISSSRAGADLAAAAEDGRINMHGPGGSIILQDRPGWPGLGGTMMGSGRRRGRGSRSEGPNTDLARLMRLTSGEEMEEMMLMEAMRLSLVEHEEQQKREAEAAKKQRAAEAQQGSSPAPASEATASGSTANAASSGRQHGSAQAPPAPLAGTTVQSRTSPVASASTEAPVRAPPQPQVPAVSAAGLGLSPTTMADLSELIEGAAPPPRTSSNARSAPNTTVTAAGSTTAVAPSGSASPAAPAGSRGSGSPLSSPLRAPRTNLPAPEPVPVPQPVAGMGSAWSEAEAARNARQSLDKQGVQVSAANGSRQSSPFGSPSTSGLAGARGVNPNNPFRRSMGESSS